MNCWSHIWTGAAQTSLFIVGKIQDLLCSLVQGNLYCSLYPHLYRCTIASLSLFAWQMSSSYIQNPSCYIHNVELLSSTTYSICKKKVTLIQRFSQGLLLCGTHYLSDASPLVQGQFISIIHMLQSHSQRYKFTAVCLFYKSFHGTFTLRI